MNFLRHFSILATAFFSITVAFPSAAAANPIRVMRFAPRAASQKILTNVLSQQQFTSELKSNPTFVKQVGHFDTDSLTGNTTATTDLKSLLKVLKLQKPSQLSPDTYYDLNKKTGIVTLRAKSTVVGPGGHIEPESYLNNIRWQIGFPGFFGDYFEASTKVTADCTVDWFEGIIPVGFCYAATAGDLFNGGIAFQPFFNQSLLWGTATAQANPQVISTGPGLYKLLTYALWASTEDEVFGVDFIEIQEL